ncbi:MAG: MazG nucleotide pyrophosphohydrolase domain-containing protein [Candidatus Absconditabacteria bacterium]|nr:MazG nucleotide pyrophosphohydrolase domain-containing protein [Candidatus Absconditabacteria bacterium]MDD3868626.1 MazG nucleotide pyrophosphohydrolase domain-containing protein [Candidatus Absconditabacteria bacterium]
MEVSKMQEEVNERTSQFKPQYRPPFQMFAQITEETGEIARALNYLHGTKKPKEGEKTTPLEEEISDLLFSVICLANAHNIDIEQERKKMMKEKRYKRDNNRFEKNP